MEEAAPPPLDELRQKLLKAKLKGLLDWQQPDIAETVGPFDPWPFENYESRRCLLIAACEKKLRSYTDDAIAILRQPLAVDPQRVSSDWHHFEIDEIETLAKKEPPWYAGGFGQAPLRGAARRHQRADLG